ncbi:hypothetical protein B0T22DRAFT_24833 [Podospora appendiculata]|uniref:Secreted protein n=1 Tax=Podospora appendiculata TaxID=314037 RepID=A0AAE1CFR5_9PEZI|nr:hypothetical protein B0T22DRAFT_24833 [Podospora appendiculata]
MFPFLVAPSFYALLRVVGSTSETGRAAEGRARAESCCACVTHGMQRERQCRAVPRRGAGLGAVEGPRGNMSGG